MRILGVGGTTMQLGQDDDSEAGEFQWPHYDDGQYWRTWTGTEGGDPCGGALDERLESMQGNENSNAQPPVQEEDGKPETAQSEEDHRQRAHPG